MSGPNIPLKKLDLPHALPLAADFKVKSASKRRRNGKPAMAKAVCHFTKN
jgi:hypothetical protein